MSDPFVGELQLFAFSFAPRDWSFANGAFLPRSQYSTLYAVYGDVFGSEGQTFAIPNAQTRFVCGTGQGRPVQTQDGQSQEMTSRALGALIGSASVALTAQQNPAHTHSLSDLQPIAVRQRATGPSGARGFGYGDGLLAFAPPTGGALDSRAVLPSGTGAAHENRQPFLALNYCVALTGLFPADNT